MGEISQHIKEWKITELHLGTVALIAGENKHPRILREISEIRFPNLEIISLLANDLESVEGLSRVYMPNLKSLGFSKNNICCIREFRKSVWPNIKIFYVCKKYTIIDQNKIHNF